MPPLITAAENYVAFYEDAAKAEAAAKAQGYTGENGESWHDFIDCQNDRCRSAKGFKDLDAAVAWLKAEIDAHKSVYGCGEIRLIVKVAKRCRYCTCRGSQATDRWLVDDEGRDDGETIESECCE